MILSIISLYLTINKSHETGLFSRRQMLDGNIARSEHDDAAACSRHGLNGRLTSTAEIVELAAERHRQNDLGASFH